MNLYAGIPMGEKISVKVKAKADLVYEKTDVRNTIIVKGNKLEYIIQQKKLLIKEI